MKTEWDIARKLADYILSFGDHRLDKFNNKGEKVSFSSEDEVISLYNDGKYVSVECKKDGVSFVCCENSLVMPSISKEKPNFSDLHWDIKMIDRIIRKRLRPLVKNKNEIANKAKQEKINELKTALAELEK